MAIFQKINDGFWKLDYPWATPLSLSWVNAVGGHNGSSSSQYNPRSLYEGNDWKDIGRAPIALREDFLNGILDDDGNFWGVDFSELPRLEKILKNSPGIRTDKLISVSYSGFHFIDYRGLDPTEKQVETLNKMQRGHDYGSIPFTQEYKESVTFRSVYPDGYAKHPPFVSDEIPSALIKIDPAEAADKIKDEVGRLQEQRRQALEQQFSTLDM